MLITLEWFDKRLNPNMKTHWRKVHKLRSEQKLLAQLAALGAACRHGPPEKKDRYPLKITFHPPCRRRRDVDNCIAAIKGALDGVAQAWGVDDKQFRPIEADFGEICKLGKITIEVGTT